MKSLALAVAAVITIAGLALMLFPAGVLSLARHPLSSLQLYASALIRIAIGILFISVAQSARIPWLLRIIGGVAITAGLGTLFIGVQRAQAIAEWVSQQGVSVVRMFGVLPLVLGLLVMYGCGSVRRAV